MNRACSHCVMIAGETMVVSDSQAMPMGKRHVHRSLLLLAMLEAWTASAALAQSRGRRRAEEDAAAEAQQLLIGALGQGGTLDSALAGGPATSASSPDAAGATAVAPSPSASSDRVAEVGSTRDATVLASLVEIRVNPDELVGMYLDGHFRPLAGRATGVGAVRTVEAVQQDIAWRMATSATDVRVAASAFGVAGSSVSVASERSYAIYEASTVERVIALPERATFTEVPDAAMYYVAEVHLGRALNVFARGASRDISAAVSGQYQVFQASVSARNREMQVEIRVRAYGLAAPSDPTVLPSEQQVRDMRLQPAGPSVPVRLVLRRIPDRFRSGSIREVRIQFTSVEVPHFKPSGDPWDWPDGAPDLQLAFWVDNATSATQYRCRDDRFDCTIEGDRGDLGWMGAGVSVHIQYADRDLDDADGGNLIPGIPAAEFLRGQGTEQRSIGVCDPAEVTIQSSVSVRACVEVR